MSTVLPPPARRVPAGYRVDIVPDRTATLPSGTVTFLFTDVEGSTRLWDAFPDDMRASLAAHDEVLTAAATQHGGNVVKHTGDGLFIAFDSAIGATNAAVAAQLSLAEAEWPEVIGPLMVRMALHTAEVSPTGDDYLSPEVNRVARIEAAGHGGQVLLSGSTSRLVGEALPDGTALLDLGMHPLRGLSKPEHIQQLTVGDCRRFPPLRTDAAIVGQLPSFSTEFVGRRDELDALVSLAVEPATRVVTVVANGGMGKTRVTVEAARRIAEQTGTVAHFVSLESITNEHAITSAVASSVGFGSRPPSVERLQRAGPALRLPPCPRPRAGARQPRADRRRRQLGLGARRRSAVGDGDRHVPGTPEGDRRTGLPARRPGRRARTRSGSSAADALRPVRLSGRTPRA